MSKRALVTGATGYVGGQLVPTLLERGWRVRVLTRSADRLPGDWAERVEVTEGSADDQGVLNDALSGVDVAYYLLHSMDGDGEFREQDRRLANGFAAAAERAETPRIVYLSGLHPEGELSPQLASRVEVGQIFLDSEVDAVVLQAGIVLGDGSASYDMLRHLTERLPAMITPRWARNRIQPIAIDDVVYYLAEAADLEGQPNRTFDVGGPDVLTYADMMKRYAQEAGLADRFIVSAPVLTPTLASHWVGLITPVSAGIAKPLVGSLVHEAICHEQDLANRVGPPPGGATGYEDALRAAMQGYDPTAWSRRVRPYLLGAGAVVAAFAAAGLLGLARLRH